MYPLQKRQPFIPACMRATDSSADSTRCSALHRQTTDFIITVCLSVDCMFIISQLWLTFHPRSTVVLLDTGGTPGTSREIYSEDAEDETRTRNPSVITECSSH